MPLSRRRRFAKAISTTLLLSAFTGHVPALTVTEHTATWQGGTGFWSNGSNWLTTPPRAGYPANGLTDNYFVIIDQGFVKFDVTLPTLINSLSLSGGTLASTQATTPSLAGGLSWSGGQIGDPSGNGVTVAGLISIHGDADKFLGSNSYPSSLVNTSLFGPTVTGSWTGGNVLATGAPTFATLTNNNTGIFNISVDGRAFQPSFLNNGTVNLNSPGTVTFAGAYSGTGNTNLNTGTLLIHPADPAAAVSGNLFFPRVPPSASTIA